MIVRDWNLKNPTFIVLDFVCIHSPNKIATFSLGWVNYFLLKQSSFFLEQLVNQNIDDRAQERR